MVDGDTKIEREYWDPLTEQKIKINMMIKDHLFFDFLKRLESALLRKAKK